MNHFKFNTIGFKIFNMPPYLFFAIFGIYVFIILFLYLLYKEKMDIRYYFKTLTLTFPFMIIGALLFGVFYKLAFYVFSSKSMNEHNFSSFGVVFYGGLTGFLLSFLIINVNFNKNSDKRIYDILAVCIPLFHSFARIGCFTAGCCYGKIVTHGFYVQYSNYIRGNIVVANRVPIQLMESGFNFILFMFLLFIFTNRLICGNVIYLYLGIYSVYRFFSEFYRGDWDRKVFSLLSPSQFYSILILIIVLFVLFKKYGNVTDKIRDYNKDSNC